MKVKVLILGPFDTNCYVLEKDENLDKGARELKYSYMYVIEDMILHDGLEKIDRVEEKE